MEDKLNKALVIGLLLFLLLLFFSDTILAPKQKKQKLSNYKLTTGYFTEIGRFEIGINTSTKFKYLLDGRERELSISQKLPCKNYSYGNEENKREFQNFRFPVAVSKEDENYAVPLVRKEDFEYLKLDFPDSLNYMYEKYFDCSKSERFFW